MDIQNKDTLQPQNTNTQTKTNVKIYVVISDMYIAKSRTIGLGNIPHLS